MWNKLVYHMPADKHPALTVTWHDGEKDDAPNKPERHPDIPEDTFKKSHLRHDVHRHRRRHLRRRRLLRPSYRDGWKA